MVTIYFIASHDSLHDNTYACMHKLCLAKKIVDNILKTFVVLLVFISDRNVAII